MLSEVVLFLLIGILIVVSIGVAFLGYIVKKYSPIIGRIFEEKPLFLPLRVAPTPGGEDVSFRTTDGFNLQGTYFPARTRNRAGVLVFCHEYLSDRWSFRPYLDTLRDIGFDLFTFDFRNHGSSDHDHTYRPLQWVTDHEVRDLQAALGYLRTRPDRDPLGVGLFGISRGGSTAMLVAANDPLIWGVITDGAFPTRGTMLAYILRWAQIYVSAMFWKLVPHWIYRFAGWAGRVRSERRLQCRFPDVETAVARLSPRPLLMIHGEKDAYIVPDIARTLFDEAGDPKELWIVPSAKHNRCREVAEQEYAERVAAFLTRHAPRRQGQAAADRTEPAARTPVSDDDGDTREETRESTTADRKERLASPLSN